MPRSTAADNLRVEPRFMNEFVSIISNTHTTNYINMITLAPIWLPHWPAWMWTISRMLLYVSEWYANGRLFRPECTTEVRLSMKLQLIYASKTSLLTSQLFRAVTMV